MNTRTIKNILFFFSLSLIAAGTSTANTLTGDWGGTRSDWSDAGIDIELVYIRDYYDVTSGGVTQDSASLENVDIVTSFDGEKLFGLDGATFSLYILGNNGDSPSELAGDAQTLSNIDSPDAWKIYEAWYNQEFAAGKAAILFGLYDINSEFDAIETAGFFINSSFGIGPDYSQAGQNGPSIFPNTSLAARLAYRFSDNYYLQLAVMDGVPGDLDKEKATHVNFDSGDGLLYAAEVGYTQGGDATAYGKWALGAWHFSESFDDLIDTDGFNNPVLRKNNEGLYILAEYNIYQESGSADQGLAIFARYGMANDDINQISDYTGFGAVYTGLISSRDQDQLGIAVAIANNGDKFIQSTGGIADESETAIELSYRAQLLPWFAVQPDVQWIKNPGMDPAIDDATVIGIRAEIIF